MNGKLVAKAPKKSKNFPGISLQEVQIYRRVSQNVSIDAIFPKFILENWEEQQRKKTSFR